MSQPLTTNELRLLVERIDPEFTRLNNKLSLIRTGGFSEQRFGGATAFRDVNKPESAYYNRVVGFGEQEIPLLTEIESLYEQSSLDCVLSLPPHNQNQNVVTALRDHGFWFWSSDCIFYLRPEEYKTSEISSGLEVRLVDSETVYTLFDLMRNSGSTIDHQVMPIVQQHYYSLPIEFYIAYIGGKPVATASAFFCDGVAWFNNAVTDEKFRGRGCHTALLDQRIASSIAKGCSLVVSDTEFGSISHRNMARSGFQLGFTTVEFRKSFG